MDLQASPLCSQGCMRAIVLNMLGIRAQETMLGTYTVKGKAKLVCACKDFTAGGKRLFDFCSIKNTVLDSDSNGSGTELDDVMETIDKQQYVSAMLLREHFWDMFIADALLGNFDRHNGNWGFLYDEAKGEAEIAPVFDCGSCLLPQADKKVMRKVLDNEDEMRARVFQFPTSAIKLHGRKINYYDFLIHAENEDANAALKRIMPRIDIEKINGFIDSVEGIGEIQKEFYKAYIAARYNLIIHPAFSIAETSL